MAFGGRIVIQRESSCKNIKGALRVLHGARLVVLRCANIQVKGTGSGRQSLLT